MTLDVLNMYNYQITNNSSSIVGLVHSYAEGIISKELLMKNLKLSRVKSTQSHIVGVSVVEV